jgi:ABC-2 type transport system ATP-binding protein/nitrous oxidase accessory protein
MIRIERVTKRFGKTAAVSDVSLDIAPGDSVALWGVNGAGKSTLIRCVMGLLRFQGSIRIGGHDVGRDGKHARMLIGYVPQELGFYDDLGVAEAVRFFAHLKSIRACRPEEVLAGVGLEGNGRKRIRELSGGMKQRLALAIAQLGDPPVLVLDEVTASLDAWGRAEFIGLLSRLLGSGRTMLFASHRTDEVAALARRVVVLERGRVASERAPQAFVASMTARLCLHLVIHPTLRERAVDRLRDGGFAPTLNGVGLLVPVSHQQKAAPFRLLADARIDVDDFELVMPPASDGASHAAAEARP